MRIGLFFFLCTSLFGFDFSCHTPHLDTGTSDWSYSADFLTLDFEGLESAQVFSALGPSEADSYSVVLRRDWCRPLEKTLFCETPSEALAEVEIRKGNSLLVKKVLRYFLFILNYQEDGSAYIKVRAKRMDEAPPLSYSRQWGPQTCWVESLVSFKDPSDFFRYR